MLSKVFISAILLFSTITQADDLNLTVLMPYTYSKMPKKMQKEYVNQIRQAWVEFESKSDIAPIETANFWKNILINTAIADDRKCIIGGIVLTAVSTGNGRYSCPTRQSPCNEIEDGFRCGPIFGIKCISRLPVSNLSKRCFEAAKNVKLTDADYKVIAGYLDKEFSSACLRGKPTDGCKYLARKINSITSKHIAGIDGLSAFNEKLAKPQEEPDAVAETGSPQPTKKNSKNDKALTKSLRSCYGRDPATNKTLLVPQFDPDQPCQFEINKQLGDKLSEKSCDQIKRNSFDNLFVTRIKSINPSDYINGSSSLVPLIVEEVKLDENNIYELHGRTYASKAIPVTFKKEVYRIRRSSNGYQVAQKPGGFWINVHIWNEDRGKTFVIQPGENSKIDGRAGTINLPAFTEANIATSDDCQLADDWRNLSASLNPTDVNYGGSMGGSK